MAKGESQPPTHIILGIPTNGLKYLNSDERIWLAVNSIVGPSFTFNIYTETRASNRELDYIYQWSPQWHPNRLYSALSTSMMNLELFCNLQNIPPRVTPTTRTTITNCKDKVRQLYFSSCRWFISTLVVHFITPTLFFCILFFIRFFHNLLYYSLTLDHSRITECSIRWPEDPSIADTLRLVPLWPVALRSFRQ